MVIELVVEDVQLFQASPKACGEDTATSRVAKLVFVQEFVPAQKRELGRGVDVVFFENYDDVEVIEWKWTLRT